MHGRRAVRARPGRVEREELAAVGRVARRALRARPAAAIAQQHVVAGANARDLRSDGLDHAGALVTEDDGRQLRRPDRLHRQVGVADPGGGQPHEDLVGARLVELHLGDLERRRGAVGQGGLDLQLAFALLDSLSVGLP